MRIPMAPKIGWKWLAPAAAVTALVSLGSGANAGPNSVQFNITKAYTSKEGGPAAPYTPAIGEAYQLTVEYDITGKPVQPFPVRFTMAGRKIEFQIPATASGHQVCTADFGVMALDGKIPYEIDIDPDNKANGNKPNGPILQPGRGNPGDPVEGHPLHVPMPPTNGSQNGPSQSPGYQIIRQSVEGHFEPKAPAKGIEYYDTKTIQGSQWQSMTFKPGATIGHFATMMGAPSTDSWQKTVVESCVMKSAAGEEHLVHQPVQNPALYPVYIWERNNIANKPISMTVNFTLQVSNVRVNADELRKVTWSDMDSIKGIDYFKFYSQPESVIEINDPRIAKFVNDTLGPNYRQKYTPYDAARKMFQAVLKRITYYYPKPGEKDERPDTAAKMLDVNKGDCGGFSILLVACFRHIGIPARVACGAWVGTDAGHCWCEMWYPHNGWVLCDGSAGNSCSENGEYAYYFGNIPDMNARFANMRGNTFNIQDLSASWLQCPLYPTVNGAQIASYDAHTKVEYVTPMSNMSKIIDICPCHNHGGFRPRFLEAVPKITSSK